MRESDTLAAIFNALASSSRVRILLLLRGRTLCVNALAGSLGVTPAAVSQHLRILRDAGLVTARKLGYYVHYQLSQRTLRRWQERIDRFLGGCSCSRIPDVLPDGKTHKPLEPRGAHHVRREDKLPEAEGASGKAPGLLTRPDHEVPRRGEEAPVPQKREEPVKLRRGRGLGRVDS